MKKIFLVLLLLLSVFSMIFAEAEGTDTDNVFKKYDKALGFSAGTLNGIGLSYQQWFDPFGFEAVAGIEYKREPESFFSFNVGLVGQMLLYHDNFTGWVYDGLFVWTALSYSQVFGTPPILAFTETGLGVGGGIGIEVVLFQHFSSSIAAGYRAVWDFTSFAPHEIGYVFQGGWRYRF